MSQTPAIGRIVHYHSYGTPGGEFLPEARAAIITGLPPEEMGLWTGVNLCVLNPSGMFFNSDVKYSETPKPGHWSWPPRA